MANTRSTRRPPRPHTQRPQPQTTPFDLDAVKNDGSIKPFRFTLGGEEFTLSNPHDLDTVEAEAAGDDVYENLKLLMDDETFSRFQEHGLTLRQVTALANETNRYYAVGEDSA